MQWSYLGTRCQKNSRSSVKTTIQWLIWNFFSFAVIIRAVQDRRGDEQLLRVASGPLLAVLHPLSDAERLPRPAVRHRQLRRTGPQQAPTKSRPRLHPSWHIVLRLWGHINKAPNGKSIKRKLWHWITTKPENITPANYYGRVQVQFCISILKYV